MRPNPTDPAHAPEVDPALTPVLDGVLEPVLDGASDPGPEPEPEPEPEPAELLRLAEPLPEVTDDATRLADVCARIAAGSGPIAVDAERASGFRFSQRAYLIQLRRHGSGTALVDPIPFDSLAPLAEAMAGAEWILHAATQDLACLAEVGLRPTALFDTELAGRLLGYPRVGLATLTETVLGFSMLKEHSAADWSTRPLPRSWLEYAALDVEVLVELRDALAAELVAAGKDEWARQEFESLLSFTPQVREEAWRRTSGLHRVRGRRALGAVRELWETRDEIARRRDVTPGRVLPDAAIVAAALATRGETDGPAIALDRAALLAVKGFHGRGADRYSPRWVGALDRAAHLPEDDLPARNPRVDGPPVARAWADRDPVAAERLRLAREAVAALSEEVSVPVENLLTPDTLRRVLWSPLATREPAALLDAVVAALQDHGARSWQIGLTASPITEAVLAADRAVDEQGNPIATRGSGRGSGRRPRRDDQPAGAEVAPDGAADESPDPGLAPGSAPESGEGSGDGV